MKPRVFIGSSTQGLDIAYSLQSALQIDADATVWDQSVFRLGENALESLLKCVDSSDFGVFVFSADDLVSMRDKQQLAARDNVVFELGLFVGRLGPKHSILVMPQDVDIRIPSDLCGINVAKFNAGRADQDPDAALGPATHEIRKALKTITDKPLEPELRLPILERKATLTPNQLKLLNAIEGQEECSRGALMDQFPEFGDEQLHYRLEALRLLSLITVFVPEGEADRKRVLYRLHPAYRKAVISIGRRMRFGSAAVDKPNTWASSGPTSRCTGRVE